MEALTKPDLLRLLETAKRSSQRDWLMILLHFWHGGRNSEIIHLKRNNFVGSRIKFARGKKSNACDQELVTHPNPLLNERPAVFEFIAELLPNQRLFPMSRWTYWRIFRRHAATAGIDPGVLHHNGTRALKHSLGTYLFENVPANVVQRRLGHVNGGNTLIYGEVKESQVDSVVADAVGIL